MLQSEAQQVTRRLKQGSSADDAPSKNGVRGTTTAITTTTALGHMKAAEVIPRDQRVEAEWSTNREGTRVIAVEGTLRVGAAATAVERRRCLMPTTGTQFQLLLATCPVFLIFRLSSDHGANREYTASDVKPSVMHSCCHA